MPTFKLESLPYAFDALEPYIDAKTMEIHYTKHHQTYCDNFNRILEQYPDLQSLTAEDILTKLNTLPIKEEDLIKIKTQGGGYVNHNIYWSNLGPKKELDENLIKQIITEFDGLDKFKDQFTNFGTTLFGSGWVWLVKNQEEKLEIYQLPNQDSPYTLGHTPILALDIWEHAYYLKYQNRRAEYIENWWKVVKII